MELFPYLIYKKIREVTAPITELLDLIPYNSSILDIGCGRGVIAERILKEKISFRYVGVDIDDKRIVELRKRFKDAEFVSIDASLYLKLLKNEKELFDCILFLDILYLFDDKSVETLISSAFELLKDNGVIIIKDVDFSILVWFQEFLSVKLFRVTKGKNIYLRNAKFYERLFVEKGFNFTIVKHRRLWYPHIVITLRK